MRWVLVLFHRYVGLSIAGFLVVAGLTGSILAFEPELDAALNPDLFRAKSSLSDPPLPIGELITRVEQGDSRLLVSAALLPVERGQSVLMYVAPRDSKIALGFDQLFADPVTGEKLGQRQWGACCLERKQLIPFIYQVHMTLFLPAGAGTLLMGGIAIAWLFDSLVGLALAWPRSSAHGWSQALRFKRGAKRFRAMFDLHRLAGLWPWPLLIILAITGTSLNLREQVMQPIVEWVSPLTPGPYDEKAEPGRPEAQLDFDAAAARAVASLRDEHDRPTIFYAFQRPELGLYGFAVDDPEGNPRNGLGPSWIYIDDRSGAVRYRQIMGEGTAGDVFFQAQLPLHSGRIGGTAGRLLVACFGLAIVLLSITGVYIWARKRRARVAHRARWAVKAG